MSDIAVTELTEGEAKSITMKISLVMTSIQDHRDKLARLVAEAYNRRAWVALGYETWDQYVTDKFAVEFTREQARQANIELGREGMSSRAVAAFTGTSNKTAYTDLQAAPVTAGNTSGERLGQDGKTYPAVPAKSLKQPRRRSLPDQFDSACWDLRKAVERLERLAKDDRYPTHLEALADRFEAPLQDLDWRLMDVIEAMQDAKKARKEEQADD